MPTRTKVLVFKVLFAIAPKKLLEKISNTPAAVLRYYNNYLLPLELPFEIWHIYANS